MSVAGLAMRVLEGAHYRALAYHVEDLCDDAGEEAPQWALTEMDRDLPQMEWREIRSVSGRLVGWEADLPAGCGLRRVQVRVE